MNLNQNQMGEDNLAGKRIITSKVITSRKINKLSYQATVLYYNIITLTDDDGNFYADPRVVYGNCMSMRDDMSPTKVEKLLQELSEPDENRESLISLYNSKGDQYLHVSRFHDFQNLRGDRTPYLAYPTHPKELGASIVNGLTNGIPMVYQVTTNGIPNAADGLPKVGNGLPSAANCGRREVKLREDKISEDKAVGHGSGDWKTMRVKYNTLMGTSHANSQKCKDEFQEACQTYGEDFVLSEFDTWARGDGRWIVESPKSTRATKSFGLHHFYKLLPELLEVRKNIQADQTSQKESLEDLRSQESIIIARDEVELESKRKQIREDEELAANFHKQVLEEGF